MEEFSKQETKELKAFREEIAILKEQEELEKTSYHFKDCNPNELGEEDRELYKKYKTKSLTIKELNDYKQSEKYASKSSEFFKEYIVNKFAGDLTTKELQDYKNKKKL